MSNRMRSAAAMAIVALVPAPAAMRADDLQLSVVSASGLRGGTVAVVIRLANDATNSAFSADVDIAFPRPARVLSPVAPPAPSPAPGGGAPGHRKVARARPPRSVDPHAWRMNSPLGDGDLASRPFHILPDAASSPAALRMQPRCSATATAWAAGGRCRRSRIHHRRAESADADGDRRARPVLPTATRTARCW